jgi:poly-gamma-glutamate synthesis protein (capsule biosynthesis protein)
MNSKILFLGDWYLEKPVDVRPAINGYPFIFNMEAPISKRGKPAPGKISLRMTDNHILSSFGRNPLAVCLANNHIMDYGEDAFDDTLRALSSVGIPFFGAGQESDNFNNPAFVRVEGETIALMGYVCASSHPIYAKDRQPGVCPIELGQIRDDIRYAKGKAASRVVVSLHWGAEEIRLPKPGDVEIAHGIIEAGADVIIGHHAHVPQPVERFNGKWIAYGLGNFVMPDLDIPVYRDNDERPIRIFKKKQSLWNKLSLGLAWDVSDESMYLKGFSFDDSRVTDSEAANSSIKGLNLVSPLYSTRFNLTLRKQRLLHAITRYLGDPKPLRIQQIASLCKILTRPRI